MLNFSVLFCFEFFFFLVLWVPTDTYIVFCGFVFFPGCVAFCFFSLFFFGRFFECISFVMIFCVFFWLFLFLFHLIITCSFCTRQGAGFG